jgi:hypothetical protein
MGRTGHLFPGGTDHANLGKIAYVPDNGAMLTFREKAYEGLSLQAALRSEVR